MNLKVLSRFPGGNAADVEILNNGPIPEVRFASDPRGGPEALWFFFSLEHMAPEPIRETKLKLTWLYFDNVLGAADSSICLPVCQKAGQPWARLNQGEETRTPDGRRQLSWLIPYPAPSVDVAFCFPYGQADVGALIESSQDYWQATPIGLSQGGRQILRLHNAVGRVGATQPGIYIVARQHSGETPGSWVLDGFLRCLAQMEKTDYVIWAVPLTDIDGVVHGCYGKDGFPYDVNRAWGSPPMRHEALVVRKDVRRWKERCCPMLALDLHAPGACESDGVYAYVSKEDDLPGPLASKENKWCHALEKELQADFASPAFKRIIGYRSRWGTPSFADYMRTEMEVPTLTIEIPYSQVRGTVLTQKSYREIGHRMALTVLHHNF